MTRMYYERERERESVCEREREIANQTLYHNYPRVISFWKKREREESKYENENFSGLKRTVCGVRDGTMTRDSC